METTLSKGWSPHSAALKRRQRKSSADASKILGALGNLDISDDDDEIDFLKMALEKGDKDKPVRRGKKKDRSPVKQRSLSPTDKLRENKKLLDQSGGDLNFTLNQDDIPPEIAEKLAIIADPETKMKDRVALEVQMRKNPEEAHYLANFRDKFDRKKFLTKKSEKDMEEDEEKRKFFEEEEKRKQKEAEELAAAKQRELDEIKAKEEAEIRLQEEVRLHRAKVLVQDSEEVRKQAEKMLIGVTEKIALTEMQEMERRKALEEYLADNPDMSEVEIELATARFLQRELQH